MTSQRRDVRKAVYTPQEVSTLGLSEIRRAEMNRSRVVPLHVPIIDDYFYALRPGEICAVQAQTHNFKSGFISAWEAFLAEELVRAGREDEIIIHVDFETVIEQQAAGLYTRYTGLPVASIMRGDFVDWGLLLAKEPQVASTPIFRIGVSLGREGFDFEDMYLANVFSAIDYIVGDNNAVLGRPLTVAAIFLDYLQAFPFDPTVARAPIEMQRRLQVREDVYRCRSAAKRYNCPIVVGLQAKQHLEGIPHKNLLIPGIYDGKETSDIGERFDRIISLWLPKTTHAVGEFLEYPEGSFLVTESIAWVRVNKQRGGMPSGRYWMVDIDYTTGNMTVIT